MTDTEKVQIILDTDMDTDCDDAGALAILNNYMSMGKVTVLGVICDAPTDWGGPCIEAINSYYSHGSIPIGVLRRADYPGKDAERFSLYDDHVKRMPEGVLYNKVLGSHIKKQINDYPRALDLYRSLLASSRDGSVLICCIGLLTVLDQLLKSKPDQYSSLDGIQLVEKKVKRIVSMASPPFPHAGIEKFNWRMDIEAAEYVVNNSPVPIHVSSYGEDILTGASLSYRLSEDHPVRRAYEIFLKGPGKKRPSWDQIALLYAMGHDRDDFTLEEGYTVSYDRTSNNFLWTPSGINGRKDRYVRLAISKEKMAEKIEALMAMEMKANS